MQRPDRRSKYILERELRRLRVLERRFNLAAFTAVYVVTMKWLTHAILAVIHEERATQAELSGA